MKGNNQPMLQKKGSVVDNIKKMEIQREERRQKFEEAKIMKANRAAANAAAGKNIDVEFDMMIQNAKAKSKPALNVSIKIAYSLSGSISRQIR